MSKCLYGVIFGVRLRVHASYMYFTSDQEVIFQMTELQCKWVARVLSGKVLLPTEKEMMAYVEEYYQQMEKDGFPKHMTHYLHFKEVSLSLSLSLSLSKFFKHTCVCVCFGSSEKVIHVVCQDLSVAPVWGKNCHKLVFKYSKYCMKIDLVVTSAIESCAVLKYHE